jgi:UDPglucose--hexose-1-phosphate uridylyltransferase
MIADRNELRQDPVTRNWVVIAPGRGRRPSVFANATDSTAAESICAFCPGREAETPPEIWRLSDDAGGWRVRVVPNKFAVLRGDNAERRQVSAEGFISMPGVGQHEVVIETPDHNGDLGDASVGKVRAVLRAYRARYHALKRDGWAHILIFRNHGPSAGTSLPHPHSQIVATPVVPLDVRQRFDVAMQHYDTVGTCLYQDVLAGELSDGRRVILESERYVAFQPFASGSPFETWIMPRYHSTSFGNTSERELDDLALILRRVLGGLKRELGDPDYNYMIQSAPPRDEEREYFVWHLRIMPRLVTAAGFELGSGMRINPTLPEESAARLRRAIDQEID